jgi:hypothetical protein
MILIPSKLVPILKLFVDWFTNMKFLFVATWTMRVTCFLLFISAIIPLPFSIYSFHPQKAGIRFSFGFTLSSASILIFSIPSLFIATIGLISTFIRNKKVSIVLLLVVSVSFLKNISKNVLSLFLLFVGRFFWGSLDAALFYGALASDSSSETRWAMFIQFLLVEIFFDSFF